MGNPHAWQKGLDMVQVRRLLKAIRKQAKEYATDGKHAAKDKDIARAIHSGKALYTQDSILMFEQIPEPLEITDFKGDKLTTTNAAIMINEMAGPQIKLLLNKLQGHLAGMALGTRPNIYALTWQRNKELTRVMREAGLAHLATSITKEGAMMGTYGPATEAGVDHDPDDLLCIRILNDQILDKEGLSRIRKADNRRSKLIPKSILQLMALIPGANHGCQSLTIEPGETTPLYSAMLGPRKTIADGQNVIFAVPTNLAQDSRSWVRSWAISGHDIQEGLEEGALYYIDPRKPWSIVNHSNQPIKVLLLIKTGSSELAEFIRQ